MSIAFIRTVIMYVIVVFALRIMGKRQLGELQPSELVVTILVSNLATMSLEDNNVPMLSTIISIFTLISCEIIVSYLTLKSSVAQKIITGNPRVVIREGVVDQKEMKNLRWSIEDLMEQLRNSGIFDIRDVSFAVVETSGTLSVYQKFRSRPLTPDMLENPDGEDLPPSIIISDGHVVSDALPFCGIDADWVEDTLKRKHLTTKDVFIMLCDKKLNYTIMKKEKRA